MPDAGVDLRQDGEALEREAMHRLPEILADLLDEPVSRLHAERPLATDAGVDARLSDDKGRVWIVQVKGATGPGVVARAAGALREAADVANGIPLVVVPYMTPAAAKAATARGINWVDLSGNAHIRDEGLYVSVLGRQPAHRRRGRPSSAFAPRSSRVPRAMLGDPKRWWRQRDLVAVTGLDDGRVSRIVRRLDEDDLLERRGDELRPADADLLLDAWADAYRLNAHDVVVGHVSGDGIALARDLSDQLRHHRVHHAVTGLPAAWLRDRFARFRLVSIYVEGDPREAADLVQMRRHERGANVQLIGPNDDGVFADSEDIDDVPVVSALQTYLDLRELPERASEAAELLRKHHLSGRKP